MAMDGDSAAGNHTAIDVLGPLRVRRRGEPVPLPRRRRSLLGLLALTPGRVVTVGRLVEGLWGDDAPPTAVRTLHSHIAKLGMHLTGCCTERPIRRLEPGYLLAGGCVRVDRALFEEHVADGRRRIAHGRYAQAALAFEAGLALWRAEAFADCTVHGWAVTEVAYLEERRLDAQEGLFSAQAATGTLNGSVGKLERLVALHPLRERLWTLLMVALHVSGRTSEALEAYQRARRMLVGELGIEPGEGLRHAEAGILRGTTDAHALLRLPTAGLSAQTVRGLPQPLNAMVGRDGQIAAVADRLRTARLVTLTGQGGVGKTRLAVEAARAAAADFDEVAFVDLAALRDPGLVTSAVAEALGVRHRPTEPVRERLVERAASGRMLIVLDNCEHLIEACAQLTHELLTRGPGVKILVTSQELLRMPGEVPWPVPPLRVPDPAMIRTGGDLAGHDAAALFAERARIESVERLSPDDARALAAICARCEGLPLALELAAGRARLLSLPEIARYLRDPFAVLTDGPRTVRPQHRGLRSTVEWSYNLLTKEERGALRRIGVFPAAFTRQAAEAVCPDLPILTLLSRLADKSLLTTIPTRQGIRYLLPETIRVYALERLAEDPDEYRQARLAHAHHFQEPSDEHLVSAM